MFLKVSLTVAPFLTVMVLGEKEYSLPSTDTSVTPSPTTVSGTSSSPGAGVPEVSPTFFSGKKSVLYHQTVKPTARRTAITKIGRNFFICLPDSPAVCPPGHPGPPAPPGPPSLPALRELPKRCEGSGQHS